MFNSLLNRAPWLSGAFWLSWAPPGTTCISFPTALEFSCRSFWKRKKWMGMPMFFICYIGFDDQGWWYRLFMIRIIRIHDQDAWRQHFWQSISFNFGLNCILFHRSNCGESVLTYLHPLLYPPHPPFLVLFCFTLCVMCIYSCLASIAAVSCY